MKKFFVLLIAVLLCALALTSCGDPKTTTELMDKIDEKMESLKSYQSDVTANLSTDILLGYRCVADFTGTQITIDGDSDGFYYYNMMEGTTEIKDAENLFFIGRRADYIAAIEGSLKLKEISYIHAEGYPAAEMKHGPIALIDAEMPVVVVAANKALYEKDLSNIQEIKARQGRVIAIVVKGDDTISKLVDYVIELPETADFLYPLLASVPLQLLAYHIAVCKGKNVDQPRNLAKSVTVE